MDMKVQPLKGHNPRPSKLLNEKGVFLLGK